MFLNEFFGNTQNPKHHTDVRMAGHDSEHNQKLADDVFWFIIDNTNIHKKYGLPIIQRIKQDNTAHDKHDWKLWAPMVNHGCAEYYKIVTVDGDPKEAFNKQFRIDMCKRLVDHYHDDIFKGEYMESVRPVKTAVNHAKCLIEYTDQGIIPKGYHSVPTKHVNIGEGWASQIHQLVKLLESR